MAHIPHDRILPQDLVDIWDHGPEDKADKWHKEHRAPVRHRMHVSDAKHAMDVDPRWKLDPEPAHPTVKVLRPIPVKPHKTQET